MPSLLKQLGISSSQEAAELEHDLGIRFDDLTPQQRETWKQQTVYLGLYAEISNSTRAARAAGVTVRTVRTWQAQDTLGFNDRLELAVLEYTEELDYILLQHIRKPDCSPSLLTIFVRAHMPEKYGAIRRGNTSHSAHCNHHHDPNPETPHDDHDSLEDIRQEIQQLNHFSNLPNPDRLSDQPDPTPADNPSVLSAPPIMNPPTSAEGNPPTPSPVPEETQAEGSPPTPSTTNPPNTQHLNRRQRRQLQRQNRKNKSKQPNSHRAR
ncbi:MAG: hypothetical protein F4W93_04780, partial [Dehalococcoidia bacterium]|nr:hypothetical protein [Dehalococcoidia bacterium]